MPSKETRKLRLGTPGRDDGQIYSARPGVSPVALLARSRCAGIGKRMSRRYPSRPVVGVGAIITEGPRVLLVRRGREPSKGLWSIPGGMLELGESLVDGIRREVREEVGREVRVLETVEVLERIIYDDDGKIEYHYVLVDYLCEPLGRTLRVADDAEAAEWVRRRNVSSYEITKGTPAVIEKAFAVRDALVQRG